MIPYGKQTISDDDIASVIEVLKSDFLTQGPRVPKFEQAIATEVGCQHAVAVNSATSALHIACLALGVSEADIVWTSPISFVASANCALYCGAEIDFVDIHPDTYNMDPEKLEEKLLQTKLSGNKLPKVVIPVHLSGQSPEMERIYKLGKEYNFNIIEDASHAIGASYQGQPVGNCKFSDITVFSFHPVKIITTGEGGVATTNNEEIAQRLELLRSHGTTRDPQLMTSESHGNWYYQQVELGFNYRMTELQAALGLSQVTKLTEFVRIRNHLAERYDALLSDLPLKLPVHIEDSYSSRHLYIIRLQLDDINLTHKAVFDALRESGIGCNLHYIPIHLQPYYQQLGFEEGQFPESESYYKQAISIPLHQSLSHEQQDYISVTLRDLLVNE